MITDRRRQSGVVATIALLLSLVAACGAEQDDATAPSPTATSSSAPATGAPTPSPTSPEPTVTEPEATAPAPTGQAPTDQAPTDQAPTGSPDLLTQEDDGTAVTIRVGEEVPLRLDGRWFWTEPEVDGAAVSLTPVNYFDDPGFTEWLVGGTAPGTVTLRAVGEPACGDTTLCPPVTMTLRVQVPG